LMRLRKPPWRRVDEEYDFEWPDLKR